MARTIKDAGRKVAGARKDWKNSSLAARDLVGMSDEEVAKEVRKDNVWPKPDFAALVGAGTPPEVVAAVKIIRDRIPQTPTLKYANSQRDARAAFVTMVAAARQELEGCRSLAEVAQVYERLKAAWYTRGNEAVWYSVVRGRYSPFHLLSADRTKAKEMVEAGFPGQVEPWKKNLTVVGRGEGIVVYQSGRYIGTFASRDEAYDVLKARHEAGTQKKAEGPKVPPDRPHLDFVTREGLEDYRKGRDIDPEEFIEQFGFLSVEFGNWVPDSERQTMLNMAHDALMDLAGVLGWEPRDMSLGGRLSAGFGSRGNGGRRAAEYQPSVAVFHFTRMNGAGSLAHEFGHALDHFVGLGTRVLSKSGVPSATGWQHSLPRSVSDALAHRGAELAMSWQDVVTVLSSRRRTKEDAVNAVERAISGAKENVARLEKSYAVAEAENNPTVMRLVGNGIAEKNAWIAEQEIRLRELSSKPDHFDFGRTSTSFRSEALKLGGRYCEPAELFARAFECFVFDELAERGGNSDYLVHGVEEERYADLETWRGNPYPAGSERRAINALMRTAMEHTLPAVEEVRHLAAQVNGR